jgi:hypothetical protein
LRAFFVPDSYSILISEKEFLSLGVDGCRLRYVDFAGNFDHRRVGDPMPDAEAKAPRVVVRRGLQLN